MMIYEVTVITTDMKVIKWHCLFRECEGCCLATTKSKDYKQQMSGDKVRRY